ncbi:rhodanese-like domain-containing protein [Candidatus Nomurabacteria bacterium]|nr:rhodanese-like domain-containing protein [Candidatus Nomurabacteria bacterium]MCB9814946.1 rhodanese-like domain-containing protein [Candidatus Nomurabacteria bacterium]
MKKEIFTELIKDTSNILLLDIREADELAEDATIEGAVNMPMGKVFTEAIKGNLEKDKQIVVFCRTGGRAAIVERELRERGYEIDGLEGGLTGLHNV